MATYRNAVLIYNPFAGKLRGRRAGLLTRVLETLAAGGHRVTPVPTTGPKTAGDIAAAHAAAGVDLVLSLGGDGTLNEVLIGIAHSTVPMAVIPAGTANVLARELGLGCNPIAVARRLAECVPRRVSLGVLTAEPGAFRRYFLLMAGVGFDAGIVYRLNLPLKYRLGQIAYWMGAAQAMGRKLEQVEVEAANETYTCAFALGSRVKNYAGYLQIARRASLLRRDFELVLFDAPSTLRLYARYLAPVLLRRASNIRGMSYLCCDKARFSAPAGSEVYVQVDGEYAGKLPAAVEVEPDALTLLVPPSFLESERRGP